MAFSGTRGKVFDTIRDRMVYAGLRDRLPELSGIASPVFGSGNVLLGALNVAGPVSRLNRRRLELLEPVVMAAAASLTKRLGGSNHFGVRSTGESHFGP